MQNRASVLLATTLFIASAGFAKDKKPPLPFTVLQAKTVAVLVDPDAGISIEDPRANQVAQKDVETAFLNWGRFLPLLSGQPADLIIVVRRGHGHLVDDTITDSRQNNRPGVINPTDNGIAIGGQRGPQGNPQGNMPNTSPSNPPTPAPGSQIEVGAPDDSFVVYQGGVSNPLDSPPIWRYVTKDGLHSHDVPAVAAFRKAIAETEKAAAAKKP
jgi:hypothetical protein